MSAFAGVFYFDRRPMDPKIREALDAYLHSFGPDGAGAWTEDGLVLVHRALHVTPEDGQELQPIVSSSGCVLTWDGRLDNRDDLLLQFHHELRECPADAVLALKALERWGIEGVSRLVGDWSLAFWQAPERRLWLASDYLGTRPLYYRAAADHLAWSSSLGELVLREGVREDLDDVFILGYLANFVPAGYTPYRPVRSVVPAHAVGFGSDGACTNRRFYDYRINTIRLRSDADYEELLREVFAKAVAARLRSTQPVWLDLSGGLDSSSVVCMADWLLKRGHVDPIGLRSFSFFSGGSPEDDDRRFITAVEQQCGCRGEHVDEDSTFTLIDETDGWVTPYHPNGARLWQLRHIRQQGGRVLLTGKGGDLPPCCDLGLESLRSRAPSSLAPDRVHRGGP
ncbi:MAG: asparagine synthase-related protein [Vicinamibacteraceae bacterium]